MYFKLLGEPTIHDQSSGYLGTERFTPCFDIEFDENHPTNQAVIEYIKTASEDDFIDELSKARELVEMFRNLTPSESYDIVTFTNNKEPLVLPPDTDIVFLGYDLSAGFTNSLVPALDQAQNTEEILVFDTETNPGFKSSSREPFIFDLLIEKHFRPMLNKNRLFDDYDTAYFCLECMKSVQKLDPNFYEPYDFEVTGVYKVL